MIQLDTPNPAIPPEQLDQMQVNNTLKLQKTLNNQGINQSLLIKSSVQTNLTTTTFATPLGMSGIVTSSGGFFIITFKGTIIVPGGQNSTFQLLIDGAIQDSVAVGMGAGANAQNGVFLQFMGPLGVGRHSVNVQAKVDGGTFTFPALMQKLQAVEILL